MSTALCFQRVRTSEFFSLKSISCKNANHQLFVRTTVHGREREMNRTDEASIAATLPTYVNAFAQASRDTHYSTHTARTWTRKGRIDSDDTRPETYRNVSPWRRFESTVTLVRITNMIRVTHLIVYKWLSQMQIIEKKKWIWKKISRVMYRFPFQRFKILRHRGTRRSRCNTDDA